MNNQNQNKQHKILDGLFAANNNKQERPVRSTEIDLNRKEVKDNVASTMEAYWPYQGLTSNEGGSTQLKYSLVYFNAINKASAKWSKTSPTPDVTTYPDKDLFRLDVLMDAVKMDFKIKLDTYASSNGSVLPVTISPESNTTPLQLKQFTVINDPNTLIDGNATLYPGTVATISYYNSLCNHINQLTEENVKYGSVKNIMLCSGVMMIHINQIPEDVHLSIVGSNIIGDNQFRVNVTTSRVVTIKELITPVTDNVDIIETIYFIDGIYLMNYANYSDVYNARTIVSMPSNTSALQLAAQIVFNKKTVLTNPFDDADQNNDHKKILLQLRDILLVETK